MAANTKFIERFGDVWVDGQQQINAQHVAAWGGIQSGGQIVGMLTGGFTSDRFGRRFNMGLLVAMLLIVSSHITDRRCSPELNDTGNCSRVYG